MGKCMYNMTKDELIDFISKTGESFTVQEYIKMLHIVTEFYAKNKHTLSIQATISMKSNEAPTVSLYSEHVSLGD